MKLMNNLYSNLSKILPPLVFNPKPGDLTSKGLLLSQKPSLLEGDAIKFSVFTDSRFYISHLFEKLIPFLPDGIEVVGNPNGQNCFMYCLDMSPIRRKFGRKAFDVELEHQGYQYSNFSKDNLQIGDIIVYSTQGFIDPIGQHAGIYVGNGRVRSRWGKNSPLLEHQLEEVPLNYWNKDEKYLTIERKM